MKVKRLSSIALWDMIRSMHLKRYLGLFVLLVSIGSAGAFSLLGPYANWMDPLKGYRFKGDIGGPMDIKEEYRWNVPVITYGFDEAFLTAFGQSGVDAVEDAIQVFNDLPAASEMDLSSYPPVSVARNAQAAAYDLFDLKSFAESLLVQQLGLADPSRYVFTLQDIQFISQTTNFTVVERNFDRETLQPTNVINEAFFYTTASYILQIQRPTFHLSSKSPLILIFFACRNSGVTVAAGSYFTGLTRDDVAGLHYLLNPQNQQVEPLLSGIYGIGTNASNFVNTALRPGVDKIVFIRQEFDMLTKQFVRFTNDFIDTYIVNDQTNRQTVRRVASQPDIVFSAEDFGVDVLRGTHSSQNMSNFRSYRLSKRVQVTDTANWINNSELNGTNALGPGLIVPGIKISFQDIWKYYLAAGERGYTPYATIGGEEVSFNGAYNWATFDSSTNIVVHHSVQTNLSHVTLEARVTETNSFLWAVLANYGAVYDVQISTNLGQWETVQTFTNSDGMFTFIGTNLPPTAFYRAIKTQDAPAP